LTLDEYRREPGLPGVQPESPLIPCPISTTAKTRRRTDITAFRDRTGDLLLAKSQQPLSDAGQIAISPVIRPSTLKLRSSEGPIMGPDALPSGFHAG
jgi:hypothetical protein